MSEPLAGTSGQSSGKTVPSDTDVHAQLAAVRSELEDLKAEYQDLNMLYEATIEHGEAVEDQLAENNILLKQVQERLEAEVGDACRYVMSLLPEPRNETPRTQWLLEPSTELGGDSFGYHDIDDDHFAIYLLDVCGHGVGAALLSASVINVLRASALPQADFRDPAAVLAGLNLAFPMEKQNDMFFTIWYGVYNRSSSELVCASGGHPPAILLRNRSEGVVETKLLSGGGGMAIGAISGIDYACESVMILPGDRLIVVSDGTFEIGEESGETLSFDDLVAFCQKPGCDLPDAVLDWARTQNHTPALPDDFSYLRVEF